VKKIAVVLLAFMLMTAPATAGEILSDWGNSSEYAEKVPGMLLRGACNATAVPFDLLMGVVDGTKDGDPVVGSIVGVWSGAQDGFDRAGRVLFDVVGAALPNFNGFPDYKPCPLTGSVLGNPAVAAVAA